VSLDIALSGAGRFPALGGAALRPWIAQMAGEVAAGFDSLGVRFTGDRAMRRLNRDFRGKDKTTDVLSFPGEPTPEGRHLGDIVISVPTAGRQAGERGHGLDREVKTLLLHGVLHCLGYDHESDGGEMERLERRLRRKWLAR
jgi:probable rRNA maturation factor